MDGAGKAAWRISLFHCMETKMSAETELKTSHRLRANSTIHRKTGIQSEKGKELKRNAVSEQVEAENEIPTGA